MRRAFGVVTALALAVVFLPRVAFASFLPTLHTQNIADFRTQIYSRVFGETERPDGSLPGENVSESFFRQFAFRVATVPDGASTALVAVPLATLPLLSSNLFPAVVPLRALTTISVRDDDYRAPTIATPDTLASQAPLGPIDGVYQAGTIATSAPPTTFHFDLTSSTAIAPRLVTFSPIMDPQAAFSAGATGPDANTTLPQAQAGFAVPMRVGHVRLQTHVEGAAAQQPQFSLHDDAVNAGATFDTRVGSHKLNVDVSSGFERMTVNNPVSSSNFDLTSNYALSNANLPVLVPAYADVSKRTLSAGVGVPVARNVSVQVQYDTQHLLGGYGSPGLSNLDARNDIYGGKVTFQIPKSASAISLSAKQYRYQDNLVPANAFTQTSADVNFTVKF